MKKFLLLFALLLTVLTASVIVAHNELTKEPDLCHCILDDDE